MRSISELIVDANKAASTGVGHMLVNRAELRQLKEYDLVEGTSNPEVATFAPLVATLVDGKRVEAPAVFELHVRDVLP